MSNEVEKSLYECICDLGEAVDSLLLDVCYSLKIDSIIEWVGKTIKGRTMSNKAELVGGIFCGTLLAIPEDFYEVRVLVESRSPSKIRCFEEVSKEKPKANFRYAVYRRCNKKSKLAKRSPNKKLYLFNRYMGG